ncbi:MAG: hypothetical protein LGR52_02170, partial [Candidatus Thiosymbion ectosymbiont of Robbea hypermnestra]|nr:hypothetical protein [Candidatus Thiosymbion ectosymbiont of Robbea hypermnestra]
AESRKQPKQVTVLSARASQSANRTGLTGFFRINRILFGVSLRTPSIDIVHGLRRFSQIISIFNP